MAIFWPISGFKGRTFKLCDLTRWDFNFCVRSSPLRGRPIEELKQTIKHKNQHTLFSWKCGQSWKFAATVVTACLPTSETVCLLNLLFVSRSFPRGCLIRMQQAVNQKTAARIDSRNCVLVSIPVICRRSWSPVSCRLVQLVRLKRSTLEVWMRLKV